MATATATGSAVARRRYDGTRRREQAAGTRDRIVAAACMLLRESSIRDWRAVTIGAVADRAGVNPRTVYRHFTNERGLRDAVLHRLELDTGIDLEGLRLEDVAGVAARIVEHVSGYPIEARPSLDPTLSEAARRQRDALVAAVAAHTEGWTERQRPVAAAMLDVLWGLTTYERLVADWGLDRDQAVAGISWVVGLVEQAIRDGQAPAVSSR
ncbi:MAG TPA: helix-turn-helix domain-containing protein [Acidimicrobiales bacterium]|nr:helix-turn-helix domain-containing protein [Acidimicrobiales bacterium]